MGEQAVLTQKKTYLEQKREILIDRRERLLGAFEEAAKTQARSGRLGRIYERIRRTKEFLDTINTILQTNRCIIAQVARWQFVRSHHSP